MAAWNDDDGFPQFRLKSPLVKPSYLEDRARFARTINYPLVNPIPPMRPDNYWGRVSIPYTGDHSDSKLSRWPIDLNSEKNPGFREFVPFGHIKPWRKAPKLYQV